MLPSKCFLYQTVSVGDGKYDLKLYFSESVIATYVRVDDIIKDEVGNRYKILTWTDYPSVYTNDSVLTTHYITEDVLPVESDDTAVVYTEGEADVRPEVYTAGTCTESFRGSTSDFYFTATFIWDVSAEANKAKVGDYISDINGKLYEIIEFGTESRWTDVLLQEVDKEGTLPSSGDSFLFRPTQNFQLYFGGKLTSNQLTKLINRDNFLLDYYAGIGELGGNAAGIFILDAQPVESGAIVGSKTYVENTVPENTQLATAISDNPTVRVYVGMNGNADSYSPTAKINDFDVELSESETKRWFVGYADVNLLPGSNYILAESSTGSTDSCYIELAGAGPEVLDVQFGSYPGSQTELKENDTIDITVTTEETAVEVRVLSADANKTELVLPVDSGSASGTITVSSLNGNHGIKVVAKNELGTEGTEYESSTLVLNQTYPTIASIGVTYPSGQGAFGLSETGSFTSSVSDFDNISYSSPHFDIDASTSYNSTKNITNTHTGYVGDGTNITITATRTANNATTVRDGLAKIATDAASADITIAGNPSRLRSSASGIDYEIIITANQELSSEPALNVSIGSWQGDWTFSGGAWRRDLRIVDSDPKGTGTFTSLELSGLSGIIGTTITSGENYEVGGFVSRTITFPAFSRVAAIGTPVVDETKTAAQIAGGNVLTRYSDNNVRENGYYIANDDGSYNSTGMYVGLSDSDFAGSNTTGTLQVVIQEEA